MSAPKFEFANLPASAFSHLVLTCGKCTRFQRVYGETEADCQQGAYEAGWRQDVNKMVCPTCPAVRERAAA